MRKVAQVLLADNYSNSIIIHQHTNSSPLVIFLIKVLTQLSQDLDKKYYQRTTVGVLVDDYGIGIIISKKHLGYFSHSIFQAPEELKCYSLRIEDGGNKVHDNNDHLLLYYQNELAVKRRNS